MIFRAATKKDIGSLIKMRLAYLLEDHGALTDEQLVCINQQLPSYFEAHLEKDLIVFVAEENDQIVATVFLLIQYKPANPNFLTGKTGTILNVVTDPEYRRRGIAGHLMQMAVAEAKRQQLSYVELKATAMGISLYESLGFEIQTSSYTPMMVRL